MVINSTIKLTIKLTNYFLEFRCGHTNILVATDVAARGLGN